MPHSAGARDGRTMAAMASARTLVAVLVLTLVSLQAAVAAPREATPMAAALLGPSTMEPDELPTAFAAMIVCGGVFVADLPESVAIDEDCDRACTTVNVTVDATERAVTAVLAVDGSLPFKAIWRGDGLGCTVIDGITEAELRAQDVGDQSPLPALNATAPWPLGEALADRPPEVDWDAVEDAVDTDFRCLRCNTRAVSIAYQDELVYERYANGISASTRLIGWSATKTVTATLAAVLVNEGRLDVEQRMPVAEWNVDPDDPRAAVTVEHVLHMASGQLWREPTGDVQCLFTESQGDCAGWYANRPQEAAPGTQFEYSTGGSTLLMRTVLQQRGEPELTHFEWPRQKLFKPLSMNTALVEAQTNGYLLGGSNGYMTSRDWTRLGLLYARDGVWVDGTRVLPEGWVQYASTPSATNPTYGAHVWVGNTTDGTDFFCMAGVRYGGTR